MAGVNAVLGPWASFFVIVGGASAGLVGLMFVVITLISEEALRGEPDGMNAFSTPTVVHFGSVLLVSALLSVPWPSIIGPELVLGLVGICGSVYIVHVIQHARKLREYEPDIEDWAWYSALPLVAYLALAAAAIISLHAPSTAMFAVAFGVLLLIFIGIHNSWDIVTFVAMRKPPDQP